MIYSVDSFNYTTTGAGPNLAFPGQGAGEIDNDEVAFSKCLGYVNVI